MRSKKQLIASVLLAGASIAASQAAVTYIDATTSNSTLNGVDFTLVDPANYTTGTGSGNAGDDLWNLRTTLDTNDGDAWGTNPSVSGEDPARIVTTFDLPTAGQHNIYGYFWIGGNGTVAWETAFELGNTAGTLTTYTKDNAINIANLPGASTYFSSPAVVYDAAYDMFEASLGIWDTAVDGMTVTVYIDDGATLTGTDTRVRYDGVGYSAVPEPSAYALLGGLCALTFVALRRRKA